MLTYQYRPQDTATSAIIKALERLLCTGTSQVGITDRMLCRDVHDGGCTTRAPGRPRCRTGRHCIAATQHGKTPLRIHDVRVTVNVQRVLTHASRYTNRSAVFYNGRPIPLADHRNRACEGLTFESVLWGPESGHLSDAN
jgi:hypothetical protein